MVLRDRFFASPPRPPKLGKQGGSSRKRNIAGGGPLAAWIGPVIHGFPATRQAAMTARLCSDRCHRQPHTCSPEPRTVAGFASLSVSPAPVSGAFVANFIAQASRRQGAWAAQAAASPATERNHVRRRRPRLLRPVHRRQPSTSPRCQHSRRHVAERPPGGLSQVAVPGGLWQRPTGRSRSN
jgi:hypothetical protein